MALNPLILMLLGKEANCDVTTPHGASILRNDIEARTKENLSINTIKRLVGVIKSDGVPRLSTRDILARYLGYDDWRQLDRTISMPKSSAFYKQRPYIDARDERAGIFLVIRWMPDHAVKIRHEGEGKYAVVESIKSKLQPGDLISLTYIAKSYPLVISEVIRGGENLGCYVAGLDGGILRWHRSIK